VRISNAGTTVGNLVLSTNRTLQLRNGSSSIGSPSAALTLDKIYRVGLHQKKGTGGSAVLEAFLVLAEPDDLAFPTTPLAKITNGTWTTQANQLQFGATNGNAISAIFDDILLDAAAMPGPGGGLPPPSDTQPPTTPTGLVATALSTSQIKLDWNPATDNVGVTGYRVYRNGGSTPIATVTSGTSYTDSGLAPATTHSYTVAAFDGAGNQSLPSALASATTLAPPPAGTTIKAITFEGNSLTGASGADSLSGSGVTLDIATPLKGVASAQFNTSSGYLTEDFAGVDDLFVSFYLRLNALPSTDTRIAFISNAGTTVGNIVLRSTGALRLRVGSTTIGESAALAVKPAVYRVGLHQKRGTGGNGVLEAFVMPANATAFGAPFAATAAGSWMTQANRLRFGATNGQAINATFDEIILDAAAMPSP
jgi:chitodextrinase